MCWNARNFANMTYPDSQRSVSTGQEDPLSDFILVVHILKAYVGISFPLDYFAPDELVMI